MDAPITNILGQTVHHTELQDQNSHIKISPVHGIYILNLRQGNVTQSVRLSFVKKISPQSCERAV